MTTKKAQSKQHMLKQFIAAWRLILQNDHDEVIEIGFHKRRKRVRFMVDGQIVDRTLGQHSPEDLPESAWMMVEEIDPEFQNQLADMMGVN